METVIVVTTAILILLVVGAGLLLTARKALPATGAAKFANFKVMTPLDSLFLDAGIRSDFDPALLKGIAKRESNLGQFREGPSGELGLMQIHPVNFPRRPGVPEEEFRNNDTLSLEVATEILSDARHRFGDTPALYLAAYNWGETRLARHLATGGTVFTIPSVVQGYISAVLSHARSFGPTDPQFL